jgi:hypothetical protein
MMPYTLAEGDEVIADSMTRLLMLASLFWRGGGGGGAALPVFLLAGALDLITESGDNWHLSIRYLQNMLSVANSFLNESISASFLPTSVLQARKVTGSQHRNPSIINATVHYCSCTKIEKPLLRTAVFKATNKRPNLKYISSKILECSSCSVEEKFHPHLKFGSF